MEDVLQSLRPDSTALWAAGMVVASPLVGSFAGTIIDRLPRREPVLLARSECRSCRSTLSALDLVPIASFLVLRGVCRRCGAAIPRDLLLIEVTFVIATVSAVATLSSTDAAAGTLLVWLLSTLCWCDIQHGRLPDFLTLPLGVAGLTTAALAGASVTDRVIGILLGLAVPGAIAVGYRLRRGRDGLGAGDVKMLGAVGAWVGWQGMPFALLGASLVAIVFVAASGRLTAQRAVPFGPFIALSAWITWVSARLAPS